jgi:glycosyltransferase involved in cell wall biosynthesis
LNLRDKTIIVSVIIPFFNRFSLLENAIQSVLQQTYEHFEIILIDDCSTDGVFQVTHDKIKLFRMEENSGPGSCRQFGLEKAKGEFILFLDSDDLIFDNFLEKSINKHLENNCILTFTYSITKIRGRQNLIWNKSDYGYDTIFPNILEGRQWHLSCQLWNRKFLSNWVNLYCWEDYEMELKSSLINNKIAHVKQILAEINFPELGSLSYQKLNSEKLNEQLKVLNFVLFNKRAFKKLLQKENYKKWYLIYLRIFKNLRDQIHLNNHEINFKLCGGIIFRFVFKSIYIVSFFSKQLANFMIKFVNYFIVKYLV